jgi:hypothetical protein
VESENTDPVRKKRAGYHFALACGQGFAREAESHRFERRDPKHRVLRDAAHSFPPFAVNRGKFWKLIVYIIIGIFFKTMDYSQFTMPVNGAGFLPCNIWY